MNRENKENTVKNGFVVENIWLKYLNLNGNNNNV